MFSPALSGAAQSRTPRFHRRQKHLQNGLQYDADEKKRPHRGSWATLEETSSLLPLVNSSSPVGSNTSTTTDPFPWRRSLDTEEEEQAKENNKEESLSIEKITNALLYGVINSILTIPCMYGYAAIIFSHHNFATSMPSLSKLVMFSSVIHQLMFTLLSSLPFAIGQVQDAGLIFLSAMATSICNSLGNEVSLEAKVSTVVVIIGIATASLGICLVLLGRFKLASLVSYLPMPVVGGYLAYIGLFCLYAGLSLSTGLIINDFESLSQLLHSHEILLCLPGIVGGLLLLIVSQKCENNSFALPACILLLPLGFFGILYASGHSIEDARTNGWISPSTEPANFIQMWDLFDFSLVHWSQIPNQITTWLGMVFVVAFSSCLDVAAIEMDMGKKLEINHELTSVGWANVVSGLTGGFTGSYIFSQTIFTYRSHTNSRIVGICVIVSEFALVLLPINIMSFVPRFFFASTLIFIAIDLMVEWLVHVYHKILFQEYIVLWLSFFAINWVSLELGMLIGIGFAILNFLLGYAQVQVVERVYPKSSAVRKFTHRNLLSLKRDAIVVLELHGYLFFGSSVQIVQDVQKAVLIQKTSNTMTSKQSGTNGTGIHTYQSTGTDTGSTGGTGTNFIRDSISFSSSSNLKQAAASIAFDMTSRSSRASTSVLLQPTSSFEVPVECLDGSLPNESEETTKDQEQKGLPTEFLLMDFNRVTGMDATAARSSFMILQQLCMRHAIQVLFVDVLPEVKELLLKNEIAQEKDFFANLDIALEFCEQKVIESGMQHLRQQQHSGNGRKSFLPSQVPVPVASPALTPSSPTAVSIMLKQFVGEPNDSTLFDGIDAFFKCQQQIQKDHVFYRIGTRSDHFYLLAKGRVALYMNKDGSATNEKQIQLLEHVIPGAMFGEVDFFGQQSRHMTAIAVDPNTVVYELSRSAYEQMSVQAPDVWKLLRETVILSMSQCITNTCKINSSNRI